MIAVIRDPGEWQERMNRERSAGRTIGFVPTMGALHQGHASLLARAAEENTTAAASIFVNPTQFDNPLDLQQYPVTWDEDLELLEDNGITLLFAPASTAVYPDGSRYSVIERGLSQRFCGVYRPGHFDGMLTVVMKLLLLSRADRAYFGEKDWQQYLLVRGMTEAFFLGTCIVPCPTVRESDGLACSSRNVRLDPGQRALAPLFYRVLSSGIPIERMREELAGHGFEVEYIDIYEDSHPGIGRRLLAAVHLGKVRLIDNVRIT